MSDGKPTRTAGSASDRGPGAVRQQGNESRAPTLRVTADLFERSAAATADKEEREALLHYAKLYRDMAELRDLSDAEVDDEPA